MLVIFIVRNHRTINCAVTAEKAREPPFELRFNGVLTTGEAREQR